MADTVLSGASNPMSSTQSNNTLKHASDDVGWEYGVLADPSNSDKVGGIYRMKQHIAHVKGNVAGYTKSSNEDKAKCKATLEKAKKKKKERNKHYEEVREEVQLPHIEKDEDIEIVGSREMSQTLGPIDRFASSINLGSSKSNDGSKNQSIQHDLFVIDAMFTCAEKFFLDDFKVQNRVINIEMPKYKKKKGGFGRHLAKIGCVENDDNYDPEVDSSLEPRRSSRNVEVRELHEEDFVSDEDMEEEMMKKKLSLSPTRRGSWKDIEKKRLRPSFKTLRNLLDAYCIQVLSKNIHFDCKLDGYLLPC
ncbi:hypothetical protein D8674_003490 [Pyrus ussuriensis x Pyrus communis]|uniref:Uncharacterized protein n=1 Tax=Pyrus ussuriensis x Pyrus communis TaxID=2448454 RepID=A0A5N5FH80_9ROSA|nr:hypothetical protein D8674_003490 [Pyrus ussuriensis x Pyrus communis]